jgi:hypothetical protein
MGPNIAALQFCIVVLRSGRRSNHLAANDRQKPECDRKGHQISAGRWHAGSNPRPQTMDFATVPGFLNTDRVQFIVCLPPRCLAG